MGLIQILFAVLIIGLLWFFMARHEHTRNPNDLPSATEVQNMHSDVQHARDAADNANALIKQQEKDIQQGTKDE